MNLKRFTILHSNDMHGDFLPERARDAMNSKAYLDISQEELMAIKAKVVSTSAQEVLEEWLWNHRNAGRAIEGRLTFV